MRFLALLCCAAVAAGCSKPEQTPAQDTTAVVTPPPPAPISLAEVAGTWTVRSMAEGSDSVLVTTTMVATADTAGWTITLPGRAKPVPSRVVEVAGDSITTESGPYESVLRKGVQVTTHSVMRLKDGKLVGMTVAHYATTAADSVVRLRTEGTRVP
jgi:hypothetical protein